MEEQLSQEWFAIRNGKFTASKIDSLLGVKGLGKTGETYCFEKAAIRRRIRAVNPVLQDC